MTTTSSGTQSPTSSTTANPPGSPSPKPSYGGDFWNFFFNSKSALAEAFRRDPKLRDAVPAYVLGRMKADTHEQITQWVNWNVKHIHYFSYRNRLPTPLSNGMDHDAGWGCMIRTGQMMLCEALRRSLPEAAARHAQHLFHDKPDAPFGLHAMTEAGAKSHVPVGQWFSPTALAFSVRRLVSECAITAPHLGVIVGQDGTIRRQDITNAFLEGKPALVLVPIMAGRDKIPVDTQRAVLKTFHLPCTLGIVGGRPKHSLYFVGSQASNVFFLDPHTVQPAFLSPETVGNASGVRGTMAVGDVDPSMVLCFFLGQQRDFVEWERAFEEIINPLTEYPLFSVVGKKTAVLSASSSTGSAGHFPGKNGISTMNLSSPSANPLANSLAAQPTPLPASSNGADGATDVDDCCYDSDLEDEMAGLGLGGGGGGGAGSNRTPTNQPVDEGEPPNDVEPQQPPTATRPLPTAVSTPPQTTGSQSSPSR